MGHNSDRDLSHDPWLGALQLTLALMCMTCMVSRVIMWQVCIGSLHISTLYNTHTRANYISSRVAHGKDPRAPNYICIYGVSSHDHDTWTAVALYRGRCDTSIYVATLAPHQDASTTSYLVSSLGPLGVWRGRPRVWAYPPRTSELRSFILYALYIALAKATA